MSAHVPVMLREVVEAVSPKDGEIYVDGTFGNGGYSLALLQAADCRVIGIDRDDTVRAKAEALMKEYPGRFEFLQGPFGDMERLLKQIGIDAVHGVVLDIGVSSMQVDTPERGFSFRFGGPLDMRMDRTALLTAADVVNTYEEEALANIIYQYGEERLSRVIAKAVVMDRAKKKFTTTEELASLISRVVRRSKDGIHPATRTFQAIRIHVNDELGELSRALEAAERLLVPGGRLVVVSFHSLEDRMVKRFLQERSGKASSEANRHMPEMAARLATFTLPKPEKRLPTQEECGANPRARSAKLRMGVRL
ncbi:MAG: 16S rRNA (cytosine(1402)-N(4))-methyltransferase RsmH [Alphaproteobacteria bacterium]|nr:16S rRNA (cytosine(1402)-N(4))-methyltransferase RsmH [Alphaproteobacteria bacterium]